MTTATHEDYASPPPPPPQQHPDHADDVDALLERAAQLLARAPRVVVFSGAGTSKESGIDTFRDPSGKGGWWANKVGLALFGTPVGWKWVPFGLAWNAYRVFYRPISEALPNSGHVALAELEAAVAKGGAQFTIMTQNVDGLHQRAGNTHVLELHGTITRHVCVRRGHPADPELTTEQVLSTKPQCVQCGSYMRPDAVLFTEALPQDTWQEAEGAIRELSRGGHSDEEAPNVMLIVGTSGVVYPVASLPHMAASWGKSTTTIVEVNPVPSTYTQDGITDIFLRGASGTVLPRLANRVKEIVQEQHASM